MVNEAGGFDGSDASISVDNVEALDSASGEPSAPTVDNHFDLWGDDNDFCLFAESPGLAGNGYSLLQVQQRRQPRIFKATLGGTLASADATVSVTTTAALDGGSHPGSVMANNPLHYSGANGSPCRIIEDLSASPVEYELLSVNHVVKTLANTVDWSDPNLRLTTQDVTVMHQADPDSPTNILTANDINVVIDVDASGTSLRQTRQQVRVLDSDTASSAEEIDEGTDC